MKILNITSENISLEMTHEQALTLVAVIREACFGTVMPGFNSRVGRPPEFVGKIGTQLHELLEAANIVE